MPYYNVMCGSTKVGRSNLSYEHLAFQKRLLARWYPDLPSAVLILDPNQEDASTGRLVPGMRYKFERQIRTSLRSLLRRATKAEIQAVLDTFPG